MKKLQEYAGKVYDNFSGKPVKSFFMIGADAISDAERVNLDELLEKLYSYIKDMRWYNACTAAQTCRSVAVMGR